VGEGPVGIEVEGDVFVVEGVFASGDALAGALFEFAPPGLLPVSESLLQPAVSARSASARASGAVVRAPLRRRILRFIFHGSLL
jgi:hypothetical protein